MTDVITLTLPRMPKEFECAHSYCEVDTSLGKTMDVGYCLAVKMTSLYLGKWKKKPDVSGVRSMVLPGGGATEKL